MMNAMKALFLAALILPLSAAAQVAVPAAVPPAPSAAPVEHRLTPEQIAAAQAEGAERNHAADLLAATRGDPSLALPLEEHRRQVHGAVEVGVGSNGAREVAGEVTTSVGDNASATVAGSYTQFGRQRYRPF